MKDAAKNHELREGQHEQHIVEKIHAIMFKLRFCYFRYEIIVEQKTIKNQGITV